MNGENNNPPPPRSDLWSLPSVWDLDAKMEWLIEGIVPLGGVTLLSAESGTGKTWAAYAIAGAVAHGTSFLGRKVTQRTVVYFDGENPLVIAQRNLEGLGVARTDQLIVWGGWHDSRPLGPDAPAVIELARAEKPLLIWDSLIEFHSGDEQSATDTRAYMKHFRALADVGATVIVLGHTGKAESARQYRGSSDFKAAVDMAYFVEGKPRGGKLDQLILRNFKSRFAPGQDFGMQFRPGFGFEAMAVSQAAGRPSVESVVPGIISAHPGINGKEIKELARVQNLSRNAVDIFLKTWPNVKPGEGKEKLYYPREVAAAQEAEREAA